MGRLVFVWRWRTRSGSSAHRAGRGRSQRKPRSQLENAARILDKSFRERTRIAQNLLSLATTRTRHVGDDPHPEQYDPDLWTDEFYFLNQPGRARFKAISSTTIAAM